MITPAFSLTATERVLPKLALNFTTASLDSRITFTRSGNTATVINSSGVIVAVNADIPRFDYNPTTLVCNGLLIEESRINALVNSLLDGTSLTTQTVVVTAAARTLSFYGTGTIVLSGTASATVVGTGSYPSRQTYTFTPTAGSLILTVTGTVQFAQLELGAFATSYIPTTIATTRNADVATMTGANFSDWFNASEGTFVAHASIPSNGALARRILSINDTTVGESIQLALNSTGTNGYFEMRDNAAIQVSTTSGSFSAGALIGYAFAYKLNSCAVSANAAASTVDTVATIPTVSQMNIGAHIGAYMNGSVSRVEYYPQRVINAQTQAFSK
jgi:hypothetical protein